LVLVVDMRYTIGVCWIFYILFSSGLNAQTFQLKTENYPPFNLGNSDGEIIGISSEIVKVLFKRADVKYEMELLPWQRAYRLALEEADHAVFSTTQTTQRQPLFKWVGPIVDNNWVFLKRANSNIILKELDDAKKYRVGGYRGDAVALYLESKGFRIDYVPKDYLNSRKLDRGRIDLWATGQLLGPYYAKENGVENLEEALIFNQTIMSIAFNINTDDAIISKLNAELELMKSQGDLDRIKDKYR
jgi:polar amino acid transport system substrate-binding protein